LCYARALLHSTQVQKAIEIYEQIDMISFPVNMKYYIQLNADFIIVEFLIYQNKYGEALELISKIKSGSSLLRFNYFYDRAIMLERELMQKKIL
jgi:hypothetical protein